MKFRQKIDKAASDQLERILGTFPAVWGKDIEQLGNSKYQISDFPVNGDMYIAYDAKKQLLGGVYSLVFSLKCENILWENDSKAELKYKGNFIKGDAYFAAKKSENALSIMLNEQTDLIPLLSKLDILSMSVSIADGNLVVSLIPIGGAFTYTVFPPMKYGALLPDADLERIRKVLVLIADLFFQSDLQAAAGAE